MTITDRRIGKKVPPFIRREDAAGVRIDSGPYIGKIKNNYDTARIGRLQVWIPDLGAGDEEDPSNWRTVSYASPFFGSTAQQPNDKNNKFKNVRHTYGFWFTPPDLDNFVLCTFIAGDPMRGFWFGCIPTQLGQWMVPAIGGTNNFDESGIEDPKAKQAKKDKNKPLPVVEFNENKFQEWSKFTEIKKPIHEEQYKILLDQGLDRDEARGVITSSSQRESPSGVFGISTPGEPVIDDKKTREIDRKVKSGDVTPQDVIVYARKGGHSFVMDDGDAALKNKLVRIRTSGGHQIIMNDTDGVFYIGNNTGNAWIELSSTGNVNIFSNASMNFRSTGNINLHADKDFTIHSDGKFQVFAKKEINFETETITSFTTKKTTIYGNGVELGSQGRIDINPTGPGSFSAGGELILSGSVVKLNSGRGPRIQKPKPLIKLQHPEAEKDSGGQWQSKPKKLKSISKIVPTHEPWPREPGKPSRSSSGFPSGSGASGALVIAPAPAGPTAAPTTVGALSSAFTQVGATAQSLSSSIVQPSVIRVDTTIGGFNAAMNKSISRPVDKSYMFRSDNPTPSAGIGPLDEIQIKALKTQIGWFESENDYSATQSSKGNYLGKYQIEPYVLVSLGYLKSDALVKYGVNAPTYPSSWTGLNGIETMEQFLYNVWIQELVFEQLAAINYKAMLKNRAILPDDGVAIVAGMLAVAFLIGATAAEAWRISSSNDIAVEYYNMGRYAVDVLSNLD